MKQQELADKIGINMQSLSKIERGVNYPTFDTLEKIMEVLDVTPNELLSGEWKYIEPSDGPAIEFWTKMELGNDKQPQLYDLSSDPSEKTNVAKSHPEIVKELSALLESVKEE